jgi:phytoene dehydrogenase-like protein
MRLNHAREHGVCVHEGTRVFDVLFDAGPAVGVTVRNEDGSFRDMRPKVAVDVSDDLIRARAFELYGSAAAGMGMVMTGWGLGWAAECSRPRPSRA